MPKPLPWSHTALDTFVNCPKRYYETKVIKSVVEAPTQQMQWGTDVHKHLELRVKDGTPLPAALTNHEPYIQRLLALPGRITAEEKIALDLKGQPCAFFAKDVWYRGVIDFAAIDQTVAHIRDYKTGARKDKFAQLKLFALHTFSHYPTVETVDARYYWTQLGIESGEVYLRSQIPTLWAHFLPDLTQYMEAFKHDIWQPRPSGLCYGWCPVKTCEFWKPKKNR